MAGKFTDIPAVGHQDPCHEDQEQEGRAGPSVGDERGCFVEIRLVCLYFSRCRHVSVFSVSAVSHSARPYQVQGGRYSCDPRCMSTEGGRKRAIGGLRIHFLLINSTVIAVKKFLS